MMILILENRIFEGPKFVFDMVILMRNALHCMHNTCASKPVGSHITTEPVFPPSHPGGVGMKPVPPTDFDGGEGVCNAGEIWRENTPDMLLQ